MMYHDKIIPSMLKTFNYSNVMQVPKIKCISLNMGLGDAKNNSKGLESALDELSLISGQKQLSPRQKDEF